MFKFFRKLFNINRKNEEMVNVIDKYHEKDTMCDLCKDECKKNCYLVECTVLGDTRRHFINGIGFNCPLKR